MADTKDRGGSATTKKPEAKPPTLAGGDPASPTEGQSVFVVDPVAQARAQHAAESRWLAAHPIDETLVPGGYYINSDGKGAHNANGDPMPVRDDDKEHADLVAATSDARSRAAGQVAEQPVDSQEEVAEKQRKADLEAYKAALARGDAPGVAPGEK